MAVAGADVGSRPSTLAEYLRRHIRAFGPMTVETYMGEVLTHPQLGYYVTRQPFGRDGDFITAPEVSQVFGELLAAWTAHTWETMGRPDPVRIVELGPGRATLMADLLRAAASFPAPLRQAATVHLVEVSPALEAAQRNRLESFGWNIAWHRTFADVPDGPILLIANELLDALPIRQFERSRAGWCERLVDVTPEGVHSQDEFRFVRTRSPSPMAVLIPAEVRDAAPIGSIAEVSPAAVALVTDIARRVTAAGGAALLIDYGATAFGARDTLQAVARHKTHPVLTNPGSADICAHVDFALLARVAAQGGAQVHGPATQGEFLTRLGIHERAAALAERASGERRADVFAAVERLAGPGAMGAHFQVLGLAHPGLPALAGFGAP